METDQKMDQRDLEAFEEAMLSGEDENETALDINTVDDAEAYIDSPYPSDDEDFGEDDFVITDRLQDLSVHSSDESVVPVSDLTRKLESLSSTDTSPKQPMTSSSPFPSVQSASGHLLVSKDCTGIGLI